MSRTYEYPEDRRLESFRVKQGAVLWLPDHAETRKHCNERRKARGLWTLAGKLAEPVTRPSTHTPEFKSRMYRHPILVLSRSGGNHQEIDFLLMTTLGGRRAGRMITLAEHASGFGTALQATEIAKHLPVEPSPRHPVSGILLKHKYCTKPSDFGNVAFHGVYTMDWRDAQLYWDGKEELKGQIWELDDASMNKVLQVARRQCGYIPLAQYVLPPAEEEMAWRRAHPWQAWRKDEYQQLCRTAVEMARVFLLFLRLHWRQVLKWLLLIGVVLPSVLPTIYCILVAMGYFLELYAELVGMAKEFVWHYVDLEINFVRSLR